MVDCIRAHTRRYIPTTNVSLGEGAEGFDVLNGFSSHFYTMAFLQRILVDLLVFIPTYSVR